MAEGCLDSDNPSSELPVNLDKFVPLASDLFRWFRICCLHVDMVPCPTSAAASVFYLFHGL